MLKFPYRVRIWDRIELRRVRTPPTGARDRKEKKKHHHLYTKIFFFSKIRRGEVLWLYIFLYRDILHFAQKFFISVKMLN